MLLLYSLPPSSNSSNSSYFLPLFLLLPTVIELKVVATAELTPKDGNKDDDDEDDENADDDDDDSREWTEECRSLLTLANVSALPSSALNWAQLCKNWKLSHTKTEERKISSMLIINIRLIRLIQNLIHRK